MTHKQKLLALLTVAATTSLTPHVAVAQNADTDRNGYVALGAAALPEYEGADAQQTIPYVAGRLEFGERYIALEGVSARANLLATPSWELGPLVSMTFGRDDVESTAVGRLAAVDDAIELGGFVAKTWADLGVQGSETRLEWRAVADASDVYGGWQSTLSAGYAAPLGMRWRVGADISTTLVSDDYAATYFSVTPADAIASGLPGYSAEGGVKDIGVTANASYAMTETLSITGFVGYRRLLGDAADSPVVRLEGSPDQVSVGFGLGYSF